MRERKGLSQEFREWWESLAVGQRLEFRGREASFESVDEMLKVGRGKSTRDMFNWILKREYAPAGKARLVQRGAGGNVAGKVRPTIWERTEPASERREVRVEARQEVRAPELSPADVGLAVMAYIDRLKKKVADLVEEVAEGKKEFGELLEEHQATCDQLRDAKVKINELNAKLQGGQRTISLHEIQGKLLEAVRKEGM